MRPVLLVFAGLLLVGAGAWLVLVKRPADAADPPDTQAQNPVTERRPSAEPSAAERRMAEPPVERPSAPKAPESSVPPAAKVAGADPTQGVLELTVRDAPSHEVLGAFRTVTVSRGRRDDRVHEGGSAELRVPFDEDFELSVEAEGHVPRGPLKLQVAAGERRRKLAVDLDRKAALTGIVLTVVDQNGAPVPRVVVAATKKAESGELAGPAWERSCEKPDGEYALPELQPGDYRIEVHARDENGEPLPLRKHRAEVRFFGNEQVPLRVQLESGALVRLSVKDAAGSWLGTEALVRITQGDTPVDTAWRRRDDSGIVQRRGGLPGKGEALLTEALAPGHYTIEVAAGPGRTTTQPLVLEAGTVAKILITLP